MIKDPEVDHIDILIKTSDYLTREMEWKLENIIKDAIRYADIICEKEDIWEEYYEVLHKRLKETIPKEIVNITNEGTKVIKAEVIEDLIVLD